MNKISSKQITNMFSGRPLQAGDFIEFHRAEYEKGTVFQDEIIEERFNNLIHVLDGYVKYSLSQPFSKDFWGVLIRIEEITKPGLFVKG